ncbi:MAG: pilin [bacterium]|nr:pilin [bacterium]
MKFLRFLLIIGALAVFSFFPNNNVSAACVLSSAGGTGTWGKDTITLGENVSYTLGGNSGCDNKVFTVEVYGKSGVDFRIRTLTVTANTAGNISFQTSFVASDFTGRSGDQTVYLKIKAEDGSSNQITSPNLTVKLLAGGTGSCTLTTAQWRWTFSNQPIIGSPVQLVVNGANCAGNTVGLDIYEEDTGLVDDKMPSQLSATFNSAGTQAVANWSVNGSWDDDDLGSYMFYFRAAAGQSVIPQSGILNSPSGIPLNSGKGCLNCNAVLAPNPVQCSDGTSQPRGTFANAEDACAGHIGDSLGGAGGGTGTKYKCVNNACTADTSGTYTNSYCDYQCTAATEAQSFTFTITNPLAGGPNDLFDIIDIVTQWIIYISVPLAVLWIMYAGFLMLTAGPVPANFQKGRDILKYTVMGLAIIFIGKGFISLIISVIELGGTSPPPAQSLCVNGFCTNKPGVSCTADPNICNQP